MTTYSQLNNSPNIPHTSSIKFSPPTSTFFLLIKFSPPTPTFFSLFSWITEYYLNSKFASSPHFTKSEYSSLFFSSPHFTHLPLTLSLSLPSKVQPHSTVSMFPKYHFFYNRSALILPQISFLDISS